MVDSVLIHPRGARIACGIVVCVFTGWLLFSPAGWPFYPSEKCTWEQWLFARLAIPITGILASIRFAIDESKKQLQADATGFKLMDHPEKTVSFEWGDITQWGLVRGSWRITETEGGTQYEVFHPNDEILRISLVGGCQLQRSLPIFGYVKKSNELLVVLRRYAGDREVPVEVVKCDPACRTQQRT